MDSNGLADPYVKLHLLPGASKVRLCLVWVHLGLEMEQRFLLIGLFCVQGLLWSCVE